MDAENKNIRERIHAKNEMTWLNNHLELDQACKEPKEKKKERIERENQARFVVELDGWMEDRSFSWFGRLVTTWHNIGLSKICDGKAQLNLTQLLSELVAP